MQAITALEKCAEECSSCTRCPLHATRTNVVFGTGDPGAELMFVGEAPGEKEDLTGVPFVGMAGKLLDKYLSAVGIPRESVYIANILKCRPPKNRDPNPEEEDACIGYLRAQVRAIKPKMIVCLGRIAAMRLIRQDFRITSEHGVFFERGDFIMCALYHPSALLHDPGKRDAMLADMMALKQKLEEMNLTQRSDV